MVGWLSIFTGKEFIGYGSFEECSHCHNKVWLEVWQPYSQTRPYTIIPLPKQYGSFVVRCRICHWGVNIRKKERDRVRDILEEGKSATKESFARMDGKEKQHLLKNLNRCGFTELARYLAFGEQVT